MFRRATLNSTELKVTSGAIPSVKQDAPAAPNADHEFHIVDRKLSYDNAPDPPQALMTSAVHTSGIASATPLPSQMPPPNISGRCSDASIPETVVFPTIEPMAPMIHKLATIEAEILPDAHSEVTMLSFHPSEVDLNEEDRDLMALDLSITQASPVCRSRDRIGVETLISDEEQDLDAPFEKDNGRASLSNGCETEISAKSDAKDKIDPREQIKQEEASLQEDSPAVTGRTEHGLAVHDGGAELDNPGHLRVCPNNGQVCMFIVAVLSISVSMMHATLMNIMKCPNGCSREVFSIGESSDRLTQASSSILPEATHLGRSMIPQSSETKYIRERTHVDEWIAGISVEDNNDAGIETIVETPLAPPSLMMLNADADGDLPNSRRITGSLGGHSPATTEWFFGAILVAAALFLHISYSKKQQGECRMGAERRDLAELVVEWQTKLQRNGRYKAFTVKGGKVPFDTRNYQVLTKKDLQVVLKEGFDYKASWNLRKSELMYTLCEKYHTALRDMHEINMRQILKNKGIYVPDKMARDKLIVLALETGI